MLKISKVFLFFHVYSQTGASEFEGREYKQIAAAKKLDERLKGAKKDRHEKVSVKKKWEKASKTITNFKKMILKYRTLL